jgi:hypothetical protein
MIKNRTVAVAVAVTVAILIQTMTMKKMGVILLLDHKKEILNLLVILGGYIKKMQKAILYGHSYIK